MPNFAGSKTRAYMHGFAPRKHPAPGLQPGLHRKTAFCFSADTPDMPSTQPPSSHPARSLPAPAGQYSSAMFSLQGTMFYGLQHFTFRRQPAKCSRSAPSFLQSKSQPSCPALADTIPFAYHSTLFFLYFFSFSLSTQKKETGFAGFHLFFFFLTNPTPAFLSQSPSLLFSPSSQYILPHRPRSGHT